MTTRLSTGAFPAIEALESRTLLTTSPLDSLNQGIFGYASNGEWVSLRYDGQTVVQENALDINSVGRATDPIAADLDGDGRPEYYLHDLKSGEWLGVQPENSIEPMKTVTWWNPIEPIVKTLVGDVNGDGREDIVTLNAKGNWYTLSWNGTSYVTEFAYGWYRSVNWAGLSLVDLDGNGVKEMIGFDSSTGNWYGISRSDGRYSNQKLGFSTPNLRYSSFMTLDMNGDRREELLFRDSAGNWNLLRKNGALSEILPTQQWAIAGNWAGLTVADLDGDGRDEILGREGATGTWWSISQVGEAFISRGLVATDRSLEMTQVLVGDVTGDAREDVVYRDSLGNFQALSWNGTTVVSVFIKNWTTGADWRDVMLVDYDGDGAKEIIGRNDSSGTWWGIDEVAEGGFGNELLASWGATPDYLYVFAESVSASGTKALIAWDSRGDWWFSRLDDSSGNMRLGNREAPFRFTNTFSADLNGDGSQDLLGFDATRGNWWGVIHDATGVSNNYLGRWDRKIDWQNFQLADLDGDGRVDIAAQDPVGGAWWGIISSRGIFQARLLSTWNSSSIYQNVMTVDLNGDGRQEIVGRDEFGSWWAIGFDGTTFSNRFLQGWNNSWGWVNISRADLEGDGNVEIIAQSSTRGEWWELFWTGSGYSSRRLAGWNSSESYGNLLVGDINGDGRDDVSVRSSGGNWWMLSYVGPNAWSTRFLAGWSPGSGWKNFVMADLLGDGKSEIIAQENSTGNWWGLFSTASGFESRLLIDGSRNLQTLGLRQVDFNHDGSDELVGVDPTTKSWWSLSLSSTGPVVSDLGKVAIDRTAVGQIPGVSDLALKQLLLRSIPTLQACLERDRLQAARLLMNWSARNADSAISSLLEKRTSDRMSALSRPSDIYHDFFEPNRGGVYCGGFSIFLNSILHLFGYDSFTLNFGDLRDDLTHVNVIVPIAKGANDWDFYIFDPTFNSVFLEPGTNRMLTFQEMILKIKTGQAYQITVRQDSLGDRDWLAINSASGTSYRLNTQKVSADSSIKVYTRDVYSVTSWMTEIRTLLVRNGYSTGTTGYLQLLTNQIISVGASPNSAARDKLIAFIRSAGIKM